MSCAPRSITARRTAETSARSRSGSKSCAGSFAASECCGCAGADLLALTPPTRVFARGCCEDPDGWEAFFSRTVPAAHPSSITSGQRCAYMTAVFAQWLWSGTPVRRPMIQHRKETVSTKSRTRSKTRLSRALGIPLTPKAAKGFEKRPYPPGEHGRTKRKTDSDYAVRLREKQRLRAQYGIREAQLKIIFQEARRAEGLTGENLVELLEMRLDAILVRSAIARTTAQARQMIVHRHILVDGKRVDRPSFRVK